MIGANASVWELSMSIDIFLLVYALWGAFRGRRKKLADMLYRLFRTGMATITGVGLFRWIGKGLSMVIGKYFSDSMGFVIAFLLPLIILRIFKKALQAWIDKHIGSDTGRIWTATIGFGVNLLILGAVLLTLYLSRAGGIQHFLLNHSGLMRIMTRFTGTG